MARSSEIIQYNTRGESCAKPQGRRDGTQSVRM